MLRLAARRWPSLRASRAPWLLAQALCVAALVLALAPRQQAPATVAGVEMAAGDFESAAVTSVRGVAAVSRAPASSDWLTLAARLWCLMYVAGVLAAASRLVRGQRAVTRLLAAAVRDDSAAHGVALPVYRIDLPLSPMLLRVCRPVLLLPRQFDALDTTTRQLIIAHELAHLARRDPLWRLLAALAHALMWFNPASANLQAKLLWAQEAGVDRAVLAASGGARRRAYAGALVEQFRHQRQTSLELRGAALAFGPLAATASDDDSLAERMRLIRNGQGAVASRLARCSLAMFAAGAVAAVLMLQPAYAWRDGAAAPASTPAPAIAPSQLVWRAPLAQLHVNSPFGTLSRLRSSRHGGIDLKARRGTAVLAAADGVVESSGDLDAGGAKYGKTIWIAHADGHRSLYAHLDARKVAAGDTVRAGQLIGLSGASGKVTGPHLHFEVRAGDRQVDPAGLIAPIAAQIAQASEPPARLH